jgi:hypothetical protein
LGFLLLFEIKYIKSRSLLNIEYLLWKRFRSLLIPTSNLHNLSLALRSGLLIFNVKWKDRFHCTRNLDNKEISTKLLIHLFTCISKFNTGIPVISCFKVIKVNPKWHEYNWWIVLVYHVHVYCLTPFEGRWFLPKYIA